MRWMMFGLLVSTVALVAISGGIARHIWRARLRRAEQARTAEKHNDVETEEAP